MLNISNLKEGDTVVFRNGGKSMVEVDNNIRRLLADNLFENWDCEGKSIKSKDLDIVVIPKPVVHEYFLAVHDDGDYIFGKDIGISHLQDTFKITVIDGVPSIEKVEGI